MTLHQVANEDTPNDVQVPPTMQGLALWVLGKHGSVALMAIFLGYQVSTIYSDYKILTEKMTAAIMLQAETNMKMTQAFTSLTEEIRRGRNP